MRRIERPVAVVAFKEIWSHFKAEELEILGAYCYAFDGWNSRPTMKPNKEKGIIEYTMTPIPKYREDQIHGKRPWTSYERFRRALEVVSQRMEENPAEGLAFAAAFLNPDGTIDSKDATGNEISFDPADQERAREVYSHIVTNDGYRWGNEEKLKEYVNGFGGQVLEKLGFKPCEIPPFSGALVEVASLKRLGDILGKKEAPQGRYIPSTEMLKSDLKIETQPREVSGEETPKRRGRPPANRAV